MNFNEARWKIQVDIMFFLDRKNIPMALEISLWLTTPITLWYWIIGTFVKLGILDL
jgi:hypothetical protein